MTTRIGALAMALLLALYLVFAVYYSAVLFGTGSPAAIAMGVALLVLAALGAAFIGAEILFGVRAEALARRLESEDALPRGEVVHARERVRETVPGGRIGGAFPLISEVFSLCLRPWK